MTFSPSYFRYSELETVSCHINLPGIDQQRVCAMTVNCFPVGEFFTKILYKYTAITTDQKNEQMLEYTVKALCNVHTQRGWWSLVNAQDIPMMLPVAVRRSAELRNNKITLPLVLFRLKMKYDKIRTVHPMIDSADMVAVITKYM